MILMFELVKNLNIERNIVFPWYMNEMEQTIKGLYCSIWKCLRIP